MSGQGLNVAASMSNTPRWSSGSQGDQHGQRRQEIVFFAASVLWVMAVLPAGLLLGPLHLGEGKAARLAAVLTFTGVLVTASVSLIGFMVNRHRKQTGSKGRVLTAGMQALMTLAYLKKGETFAQLGARFGVGTTTAWRYVNETVTLLSARSPKLNRALTKAREDGLLYLVVDGTLIPIDRVKADRPFYSGKHKKHGTNLQVIASSDGTIVWVSGPLPGSAHDLKAARIWGLVRELAASGMLVPADKGCTGAGGTCRRPTEGKDKRESS